MPAEMNRGELVGTLAPGGEEHGATAAHFPARGVRATFIASQDVILERHVQTFRKCEVQDDLLDH